MKMSKNEHISLMDRRQRRSRMSIHKEKNLFEILVPIFPIMLEYYLLAEKGLQVCIW